jgi:antitoxin (DNA-binding transcriptional repressor) of toxin-antitoxin stability system
MITRPGKEIARLVPARAVLSREETQAATAPIRARGEQQNLGRFDWKDWKVYRHEGRP